MISFEAIYSKNCYYSITIIEITSTTIDRRQKITTKNVRKFKVFTKYDTRVVPFAKERNIWLESMNGSLHEASQPCIEARTRIPSRR